MHLAFHLLCHRQNPRPMKKFTILFLLTLSLCGFSQNCQTVITNASFQTYFNQISQQPNDQKKLERANEMIRSGCLLTTQVKKTAMLFSNDESKLAFCKAVYLNTYDHDSDEGYQVYDVFSSLSYALRLYDYAQSTKRSGTIITEQTTRPMEPVVTRPEEITPIFGDYQYPSHLNYKGPTGCAGPVVNEEFFMSIARKACCLPYDDSRSQYIIENTRGLCISMTQAMKLTSFIHTQQLRLTTMKTLFPQIYDQGNYQSAAQVFNSQDLKNDWNGTIQLTLNSPVSANPTGDCTATDADLKNTVKSVNTKNFPSDKMDVLRLAAKNKCYNTAQIRSLCELFMLEKDKLDVMKIFYAKCSDKDRFDQLTDVFIAYYYQQELMKFIKNGGK
jgi:hypothetical protein